MPCVTVTRTAESDPRHPMPAPRLRRTHDRTFPGAPEANRVNRAVLRFIGFWFCSNFDSVDAKVVST